MINSFLTNTVGGASDRGPLRKANEDSFLLPDADSPTHLGDIYIVADGVGGQKNGAEASQLAVRIIQDEFYKARAKGKDIPTALQRAANEANLAIYEGSLGRGMGKMGCTVVTAVHHENQRIILHAGDARAYLLRDEELRQLTRDDSWIQLQLEEGVISEEEAANHRLRHVVTRVLGNNPTLEVTISEPMPIETGDILLLCSDGLYDVVSPEKIQQTLYLNPPQEAAEILISLAIQAPATDNITAVVIESIESHPATKGKQPIVAMPSPESKTAVSSKRRRNTRLFLWIIIIIIAALLLINTSLGQQLIQALRGFAGF